jgi:serine/threonine-protein kinase
MMALLIVLSMGVAIVVTTVLGQRIADEAIQGALSKSQSAQASFQLQRFEQLKLISRLFGSDPYLIAYLAEASETQDTLSMLDLLEERQSELGFDFAIVLDPGGRVVVRTDQPEAVDEDLSDRALVAMALDETEAFGLWREGSRLYSAAAVPLVKDFVLEGFMITGFAVDDELARQVRNVGSAEIAYLVAGPTGAEVVATTLDRQAGEELVLRLRTQGSLRDALEAGSQRQVDLGGHPWIAQLAPLRDAVGEVAGATVALVSLREARATYRQIERVLVGVGLLSMLLAFALSYALSRRSMRPVRTLLAAAEGARRGDYEGEIPAGRGDEVGRLADAFNGLLGELREKRDMQAYVASLSRSLPEPAARAMAIRPHTEEVAILGIELRRLANPRIGMDPESAVERLSRDLRRAKGAIQAAGGSVESCFGHRVIGCFSGLDASYRALIAATRISEALSRRESAFDEIEPPAVAMTTGEVVMGSVAVSDQPERTVVGLAVQQLEGLLREAAPGDIVLSQECHRQLTAALERGGLELQPQRGILSTQPLYLVSAEMAARVTGQATTQRTESLLESVGESRTLADVGPGAVLGDRYEIQSVLGAGGMGVVYKARDRELNDLVALKMLRQDGPGGLELDSLKNELRLARRITHPNVLRTYDFGDIDGVPFISMEYVRGLTLRYLLDQTGRLPYSAGLRLGRQLSAGLAAAHAERVLHLDIKPENIILDSAGDARIMDFGISQPLTRATPGTTQPHAVAGTPHYLAPEQLRGQPADTRADIYASGMVLYEIFTGQLPFSGGTPMEIINQHLSRPPAPPSTHWSQIPPRLEEIILRCLAKKPDDRFASAEELGRALETVRLGAEPMARSA